MYKGNSLNKMLAAIGVAAALSLGAASAYAQAPRSHTVGVTKGDQKVVATGWSVKKDIMGKEVYNDNNEKIGSVDDLIVSRNKSLSYAIIGVGGFLGIGTHDVAIPMNQIKSRNVSSSFHSCYGEILKVSRHMIVWILNPGRDVACALPTFGTVWCRDEQNAVWL